MPPRTRGKAVEEEISALASKKTEPVQVGKKGEKGSKRKELGAGVPTEKPNGSHTSTSKPPRKRGRPQFEAINAVIAGRSLSEAMETPTFRPTEEEFADFYAYAEKLDKLVGHIGVCKVIPPQGWKARRHDDGVYTLEESLTRLEEEVEVKQPILQNAIGGKGVYLNMHQVKRKMSLGAFKQHAMKPENMPPCPERNFDAEAIHEQERKFWRNVLFNPPIYGADCPVPKGFRGDGSGGLFDPEVCGDWDLSKLPSLLTTGIKKPVPGVNTPFLYIGMYRAAFAWHCEDMDLHSINYLHFGAPKTWYTVPATHGKELEALARQHFPDQANFCKEFLRHKTNMIEPSIVLRAGIPLTRTVQRPGEFIINFPGAYHSGFNNGYNCAESCNFATEYWIPFGVQARPCGCFMKQNSVRIDVDAMLRKVKDVRVKGEQWMECELCHKWRLQPPYMMHLMKEDAKFTCSTIKGLTCSSKEAKWENDQWEVDGKVMIGIDSTKENWVMCEQCSKWRKVPDGQCVDAEAAFICSMLEGWGCDMKEEGWEQAGGEGGWQMVDATGSKKTKYGEWTEDQECKVRVKYLVDELAAFGVDDSKIAECNKDKNRLEDLLSKAQLDWSDRWVNVHGAWQSLCASQRDGGVLTAKQDTLGSAAQVAQKLWLMCVQHDDKKEEDKWPWVNDVGVRTIPCMPTAMIAKRGYERLRDLERKRQKLEAEMHDEDETSRHLIDLMKQQSISLGPAEEHSNWRYKLCRFSVICVSKGTSTIPLGGQEMIGERDWALVAKLVRDTYSAHSYGIVIPLKPPLVPVVAEPTEDPKMVKSEQDNDSIPTLSSTEIAQTPPSSADSALFPPVGHIPEFAVPAQLANLAKQYLLALQSGMCSLPQVTSQQIIPPIPPPAPVAHLSIRLVACGSKEGLALSSHFNAVGKLESAKGSGCYSLIARDIQVACGYYRWSDEYRAKDAGKAAERRAESFLASIISHSIRSALGVRNGGLHDESCANGLTLSHFRGDEGVFCVEEAMTEKIWETTERQLLGDGDCKRMIICDTSPPAPPRPVVAANPESQPEITPNFVPDTHHASFVGAGADAVPTSAFIATEETNQPAPATDAI